MATFIPQKFTRLMRYAIYSWELAEENKGTRQIFPPRITLKNCTGKESREWRTTTIYGFRFPAKELACGSDGIVPQQTLP